MASEPNQPRRSLLFVPATRLDRYAKALATGADAVCIDLEDAVGDEAKGLARRDALRILATQRPGRPEVWLRINAPQTALSHLDLEALREAGLKPDALVVPKVAGADTVVQLESELTGVLQGVPLVLMIESAKAMVNIDAIAGASADVTALLFGAIDYSADVGCAVDWEALLYARSRVVLAAAAASVDVLDAPFMRVPSRDALEVESRGAARLGFTGKAAIHPTQIDVIQEAFTPTRDEITWARRIIAAYEATPSGALLVDGILVDRPVIITARRVLRKASSSKPPSSPPA